MKEYPPFEKISGDGYIYCRQGKEVYRSQNLFLTLLLEHSISPNSDFKREVVNLLGNKPQQTLKAMGFPTDWKSEPLWQC